MSERPNEASETAESEVLRLQAALRSERDKVTSLQAEIQQLKVSQVEIVRTSLLNISGARHGKQKLQFPLNCAVQASPSPHLLL